MALPFFKCPCKFFKLHCHSSCTAIQNLAFKIIAVPKLTLQIPKHTPLQIPKVNTKFSRDTVPKKPFLSRFPVLVEIRKQTQSASNLVSFLQGCCLIDQKCYMGYYAN